MICEWSAGSLGGEFGSVEEAREDDTSGTLIALSVNNSTKSVLIYLDILEPKLDRLECRKKRHSHH